MEEVNSKQKNALLRALIKEFKERWAQYKDGGLPYEDQFDSWEKDGWQWKWEVDTKYYMLYLAVEPLGEHDEDEITFGISVGAGSEPFIEIEAPVTYKALDRATKSLVKWIKKELLVIYKNDDIEIILTALD